MSRAATSILVFGVYLAAVGAVLLFVPDLLAEVRASYPQVEAAGGRWVPAGLEAS